MTYPGAAAERVGGVRRFLTVVAVVVTLVGLPAVLVAGALLRRTGVAPAVTNANEVRLRRQAHGHGCADGTPEVPPAHGAASALTCTGPGGVRLRVSAYRNDAARAAVPVPAGSVAVSGANWRVELPAGSRDLAARIATSLTGRLAP